MERLPWTRARYRPYISCIVLVLCWLSASYASEDIASTDPRPPQSDAIYALDIPVFLNGYRIGYLSVWLNFQTKAVYIVDPHQWKNLIQPYVSKEAYSAFQHMIKDTRLLDTGIKLQYEGLELYFDNPSQSIYLDTMPAQSPLWHASFREGPFPLTREQRMRFLEDAQFSGFANVMIGQKFINSYFPDSVSFSHQSLGNIDLNINYKNVVFNGFVYYLGNSPVAFKRGEFLLTFDVPKHNVRVNLGEFATSSTSFSQSVPLAGVNINKNRGLYMDAIIGALNRNQILLNAPSKVEVFLNGSLIKILDLDAGPIPLDDFPLIEGINDVVLRVMGTSGEIRIVHLSMLYYARLLEPGEDEYSFSFGVPTVQYQDTMATRVSLNKFTGPLYLSGVYRRGARGGLTFGGYLQGDFHQAFGGVEALYHKYPLYSAYELALSHLRGKNTALRTRLMFGPSQEIQDRYPAAWQLVLTYSDANFGFFGEGTPNPCIPDDPELFNNVMFSMAWGLGISYFAPLGIGFVGEYDVNRRGGNSLRWQVDVAIRPQRQIAMQLIVSQEYLNAIKRRILGKSIDTRFYFTFNLIPEGRNASFQSEYNSFQRTLNASATYFKRFSDRTLVANAGYMQAPRNHTFTGDITYEGRISQGKLNRYLAKNRPLAVNTTVDVNTWNAGAGLLWKDQYAALTRPLSDSFVLTKPPGGLQKFPILVQTEQGGVPVAEQSHFIEGVLCTKDNQPMAYQEGVLYNGERQYPFMTNAQGVLHICNVLPGKYYLSIPAKKERLIEIQEKMPLVANLGYVAINE